MLSAMTSFTIGGRILTNTDAAAATRHLRRFSLSWWWAFGGRRYDRRRYLGVGRGSAGFARVLLRTDSEKKRSDRHNKLETRL